MRSRRSSSPRQLSAGELELIEALLGGARARGRRFLGQLERAVVVGGSDCGCPSIELEVDGCAPVGRSTPLLFADGESPEGVSVGIILWVRGACLSGLEVHPWDGRDLVRLPDPASLSIIGARTAPRPLATLATVSWPR